MRPLVKGVEVMSDPVSADRNVPADSTGTGLLDYEESAARQAVLGKAVGCAGQVPGSGDLATCLQAYYRHVAVDDLTAAGPERLAAVIARHVELAGNRPQGRALVEVRRGGDAVLDPPADVIDVVTDDMPFLVDSITMELANHGLSARLVVHPQLRVRRDVTGALREITGQVGAGADAGGEPSHDEYAESWTHIEIPPLAEGEAEVIAADLLRVLATSGSRSRTTPGCGPRRSGWRTRCWHLRARARAEPTPRPRSPSCCAGWPISTSPSSGTGNTTCRSGRTA
jgi:hypothetical protein